MDEIVGSLRDLGLKEGDTVLVHSSLTRIGWVPGGVQAVIEALLEVVGADGNLMMPTHTGQLTEPARWRKPPVPESWWPVIRSSGAAYDPRLTPTRDMGAIAEAFRSWPGALRSAHPHVSFAAHGPDAEFLTEDHQIGSGLGERSPLARLYDLNGLVLLLGVGHSNNTSLHLAEYRADFPDKMTHEEGAPMLTGGVRIWHTFEEQVWHDDDFQALGGDFALHGGEKIAMVGGAETRLMVQRELVDYAVGWMEANRSPLPTPPEIPGMPNEPDS